MTRCGHHQRLFVTHRKHLQTNNWTGNSMVRRRTFFFLFSFLLSFLLSFSIYIYIYISGLCCAGVLFCSFFLTVKMIKVISGFYPNVGTNWMAFLPNIGDLETTLGSASGDWALVYSETNKKKKTRKDGNSCAVAIISGHFSSSQKLVLYVHGSNEMPTLFISSLYSSC